MRTPLRESRGTAGGKKIQSSIGLASDMHEAISVQVHYQCDESTLAGPTHNLLNIGFESPCLVSSGTTIFGMSIPNCPLLGRTQRDYMSQTGKIAKKNTISANNLPQADTSEGACIKSCICSTYFWILAATRKKHGTGSPKHSR